VRVRPRRHQQRDHRAADAAAAGVAVSGAIIVGAGGWYWLDPVTALVIAVTDK
jgi:divalent metal cation (Fe/Co/Zn/Cd) transporter